MGHEPFEFVHRPCPLGQRAASPSHTGWLSERCRKPPTYTYPAPAERLRAPRLSTIEMPSLRIMQPRMTGLQEAFELWLGPRQSKPLPSADPVADVLMPQPAIRSN